MLVNSHQGKDTDINRKAARKVQYTLNFTFPFNLYKSRPIKVRDAEVKSGSAPVRVQHTLHFTSVFTWVRLGQLNTGVVWF